MRLISESRVLRACECKAGLVNRLIDGYWLDRVVTGDREAEDNGEEGVVAAVW